MGSAQTRAPPGRGNGILAARRNRTGLSDVFRIRGPRRLVLFANTAPPRFPVSLRMKKFLVVLVLLAAAAGGWYYYTSREAADEKPVYATAAVGRADILQSVTATGQLDPLLTVDVGSQISGLVKKLYVDFNSKVKKGDKLAEIDPATYLQRLRQAEANLASAEANSRLQRLNAERIRSLFEQKLVTQQELDQSVAQLQQSESQLLTNRAAVENARVDLERCTISSPIDGMVMNKQTEEGKTVAASLNAPVLFTIANDLSKMQIAAAVSEADVGSVQVGQQVSFTVDAFPNRPFTGEVVQVRNAPRTVSNVVTYDTIINVSNDDLKLRPGMTANVSIIVARRDGALRVPNAALRVRMPEGLAKVPTPPPAAAKGDAPKAADGKAEPAKTEPAARGDGRRSGGGGEGGRRGGFGGDMTPEQRQVMREIMTEVGVDFRSGPPTAEQREQMRRLMIARGLPVPEAAPRPGETTVTTRTVFVLRDPAGPPEAVTVKAGITDGSGTEIIEGLTEGDLVVTSVTTSGGGNGARPAQGGAPSNPFAGQRRF
jgi:HlyD family secretion protein